MCSNWVGGQGKSTYMFSAECQWLSAFRSPPPPACWSYAKCIIGGKAESGTLWKTVTLIYPDPWVGSGLALKLLRPDWKGFSRANPLAYFRWQEKKFYNIDSRSTLPRSGAPACSRTSSPRDGYSTKIELVSIFFRTKSSKTLKEMFDRNS